MNNTHPENPRMLAYCQWQDRRQTRGICSRNLMRLWREPHGAIGWDPRNDSRGVIQGMAAQS